MIDEREIDALVDFTVHFSSVSYVRTAAVAGVACIVGTTGFDEADLSTLAAASERVPVLRSANFAPSVQALLTLAGDLAQALPEYDIEATETYHNGRRDAPSGTVESVLTRIDAIGRAPIPSSGGRTMHPATRAR